MKLKVDSSGSLIIDYEDIKLFCHDEFGLKAYQNIKAIFQDNDEIAYFGLKIVTHLAQISGMFEEKPFRVICYIKSYFSSYIKLNEDVAHSLLKIILDILEMRVEDKSSDMKLLISELKGVDFFNPDKSFYHDVSSLETESEFKFRETEFFEVEYIDTERFVKGYVIAYGLAETKEDKIKKILDKYPNEVKEYFEQNYEFIESLKTPQIKNNKDLCKPIIWLKSDGSLRQLINGLQEKELIQSADIEIIIRDHFKPVREQNNKPVPIVWQETQKLLVYFFRELSIKHCINPKNEEWKLLSEHFIKSNGDLYIIRSLTQEAYNQKEGNLPASGISIIDTIINRLIVD